MIAMKSSVDIEAKAVALFTNVDAFGKMYSLGLKNVHFDQLVNKRAFDFTQEYWRDSAFKSTPTKEVLEDKVEGLVVRKADEAPTYVVNELKRRYAERLTKKAIYDAADTLEDNPINTITSLSESLFRIKKSTRERRNQSDLVSDVEDRRHKYALRASKAEGGGLTGESLGFDEVDEITSGIRPGELFTIAGAPKSGKTWLGLQIIKRAMERGKRSIFFSLEMNTSETVDRLEALLSGVSYNKLDKACLSSEEVMRLRKAQDKEKDMGPVRIVKPQYGDRTVDSMISTAKDFEADIIVIDQLSFMESALQNKGRSEEVARIILDLKSAISADEDFMIPTVLLTQFNRGGAAAGENADINSLAFSSEIERSSDALISLSQSKEQRMNNALTLQILASRRCDLAKWLLYRDLYDKTDFHLVKQITEEDE